MGKSSFFRSSVADFALCEPPGRPCDHVSASGSAYWYGSEGVWRESDHWGFGISSCDWLIEGCAHGFGVRNTDISASGDAISYTCVPFLGGDEDDVSRVCGFCPWDGFRQKR